MWQYRTSSPDRYLILKEFARENRKHPTPAETALWYCLKDNALGTRVHRQHIVGDYIVDFLIPYFNLVIEVDGGYHAERVQQEDDDIRSAALNKMGLYVMRFNNDEILYNPKNAVSRIKELINKINK